VVVVERQGQVTFWHIAKITGVVHESAARSGFRGRHSRVRVHLSFIDEPKCAQRFVTRWFRPTSCVVLQKSLLLYCYHGGTFFLRRKYRQSWTKRCSVPSRFELRGSKQTRWDQSVRTKSKKKETGEKRPCRSLQMIQVGGMWIKYTCKLCMSTLHSQRCRPFAAWP
jgi:hypothetical protein